MPFDCFALRAGSPQTGLPLFFLNLFQLSMKEEAKCVDTSDRFHKRRHIRLYLSILNRFFIYIPEYSTKSNANYFNALGDVYSQPLSKTQFSSSEPLPKPLELESEWIDRLYFAFPY